MLERTFKIKVTSSFVSLWWEETLLEYQNFSKDYDHACLQNFLLFFMSLLTTSIAKKSGILVEIYFIFLKKRPRSNLKI